jgi:hypothetical protein
LTKSQVLALNRPGPDNELHQIDAVIIYQKDLNKIPGRMDMSIVRILFIQEFLSRYVTPPAVQLFSQAPNIARDRTLSAEYSHVRIIQNSPDFWKPIEQVPQVTSHDIPGVSLQSIVTTCPRLRFGRNLLTLSPDAQEQCAAALKTISELVSAMRDLGANRYTLFFLGGGTKNM